MSPGFSSPPNQDDFRNKVWESVCQIPPGRVATYGQIAALISPPQGISSQSYRALGPRWVGAAMAICPDNVPWQRVVNSQGKISIRGTGEDLQRQLLEAEGVIFDERGRIDLKRFKWVGPREI